MAKLKLLRGPKALMSNVKVVEGQILVTTDQPGIYYDTVNSRLSLVPQNISDLKGNLDGSRVTGTVPNAGKVNNHTVETNVPSDAKFTDTTYGVATSAKLGLIKSGTDITVDSSGNVSVNNNSHTHIWENISNRPGSLPASDVSAWAKAETKPTYSKSEVGLGNVDNTADINKSVNYANTAGRANKVAASAIEGVIDLSHIPQAALERLFVVENDTARFKLTSSQVQNGDVVKVTATGKMYYVIDNSQLTAESGYMVFSAGTAASVPWSGVTGKPNLIVEGDGRLTNARPASDVYSWAKASSKPSYTKTEIGLGNVENKSSATIRSEISSSNVTAALGYTPVKEFTATGSVSNTVGTPSVKITKGGTATNPTYDFAFTNIKGATGAQGPQGVQGKTGATGPQGPTGGKGATGATGNGISNITAVSTSAASSGTNTYRINMTNGTYTDFTVKNGAQGATGGKGPQGPAGANGVSCTHSWSGSKLTITSASGSSTVDLRGPQGPTGNTGNTGATGPQGPAGRDGLTTSVAVNGTTYTQSSGKITLPNYPTKLPASDVYSWAKASSKPNYSWGEISGKPRVVDIKIQSSQPSGQSTGDLWYTVI